jgi:hypothetical protein
MIRRLLMCAVASVVAAGSFTLIPSAAQANSYNWGSPSDVCDKLQPDAYEWGVCVQAISPQQTVKGTTSLQYMVSCVDAPAVGNTSGLVAPLPAGAGAGPYFQSFGAVEGEGQGSYSEVTAWTTGSSVVSGEITTTNATVGQADGSSVSVWGTTPVKVYNAEVAWDSTSVTFGAACLNALGVTCWAAGGLDYPGCEGFVTSATADAAVRRIEAMRSARISVAAQTAKDFATGKRQRAEYQVIAQTATGVEVHDRINLRSGKTERTRLMCPSGMVPAGDPKTSYGFDALKDVSGHRPAITAKRNWSTRGVELAFTARTLKYPTVAYTSLSCAKAR